MRLAKGDFVCHIEQTHQPTIWEVLDSKPVLDPTDGGIYSVLPILYKSKMDDGRVLVTSPNVRYSTWEELAAELHKLGYEVDHDFGVPSFLVVSKDKWVYIDAIKRCEDEDNNYAAEVHFNNQVTYSENDLMVYTKEFAEANQLVPLLNRFLDFQNRIAANQQNE